MRYPIEGYAPLQEAPSRASLAVAERSLRAFEALAAEPSPAGSMTAEEEILVAAAALARVAGALVAPKTRRYLVRGSSSVDDARRPTRTFLRRRRRPESAARRVRSKRILPVGRSLSTRRRASAPRSSPRNWWRSFRSSWRRWQRHAIGAVDDADPTKRRGGRLHLGRAFPCLPRLASHASLACAVAVASHPDARRVFSPRGLGRRVGGSLAVESQRRRLIRLSSRPVRVLPKRGVRARVRAGRTRGVSRRARIGGGRSCAVLRWVSVVAR